MTRFFNPDEQDRFDALFEQCLAATRHLSVREAPESPPPTPPLSEEDIRRRRRAASSQLRVSGLTPYDRRFPTPRSNGNVPVDQASPSPPTTPESVLATGPPPTPPESPVLTGTPPASTTADGRTMMGPPPMPEYIGMVIPWRTIWVPLSAIHRQRRYRYLTERGRYLLKFDHEGHLTSLQLLPRNQADD